MSLLYKSVELFACLLSLLLFFLFVEKIYTRSVRFRVFVLVLLLTVLLIFSYFGERFIANWMVSLLAIGVEIFYIFYQYEASVPQAIFAALLFNLWDVATTNLVFLFLKFISGSSNDFLRPGSMARLQYLILINVLQYLLMLVFIKVKKRGTFLTTKSLMICLAFFVPDFLMVLMLHLLITEVSELPSSFVGWCYILAVLMLATSFAGMILVRLQRKEQVQEEEDQLLRVQLLEQEHTMNRMQKQYDSTRILRHDLKNILLNYRILLKEGHIEEVIKNINEVVNSSLESPDKIYTTNKALNYMLHEKEEICSQNLIRVQYRVQLSETYIDLELMVLLANLFENAIEAECKEPEKNRAIVFELIEKDSNISIVIQNVISTSVIKSNPDLKTRKKEDNYHGIGLKSVRSVVSRRSGVMQIYEKENMFSVHIILPK